MITQLSLFVLFFLLLLFNALETFDYRLQDILYQQETATSPDIVIVGIDDQSLQILGKWPWPRDYHGELLRLLNEAEPAVIGYDVIFAEESMVAQEDDYLVLMAGESDNLIFPVYGNFDTSSARGTLQANDLSRPFAALDEVSDAGHINTIMDNDGIVRKALLAFDYHGKSINSLSWEAAGSYLEGKGEGMLAFSEIPLDPWHRTPIRYSGIPGAVEVVSFFDVLSEDVPGEYFRGKVVLVGPTAVGLADDYYFTPMAPQVPMYGVEIHANIIAQLLDQRFWAEVPFAVQVLIMLALGAMGYLLFNRFSPGVGAFALLGLLGGFLLSLKLASSGDRGYVMSFIYPSAFLSFQYVGMLGEKFIVEMLEKKRVTDVFGKYVAPQIVDKILEEGEIGLQLGGTRREITVLFVDIRGFTPLSEAAEPEVVVSILNDYLTLCAESIFTYGGTLDKYIGDATMALFNAPLDLENHQLKAVQTAWAMRQGAQPLQEKLEKQFGKVVRFGIGIHTGSAIVGNIGAAFRMDYTAIGDTVNTAARLESNSKPGQILISQEVYEQVKDYVKVTDLGTIQVKGKAQVLRVYQVDELLIS